MKLTPFFFQYFLSHFECKNDITITVKLLYSSVKFDDNCNIILMFKMK